MEFNCKKDIIQITPLWEGERMQDGRPRVSDEILEKIRHYSLEAVSYTHLDVYKRQKRCSSDSEAAGRYRIRRRLLPL